MMRRRSVIIGKIPPPDSLHNCTPQKHNCPTKVRSTDGGRRSAEAQLGKQILIRLYAHLLFMTEAMATSNLMNELRAIRNDLNFIKEHMVDIDSIMTEDDYLALGEYRKEKNAGELVSHENLKKELGL